MNNRYEILIESAKAYLIMAKALKEKNINSWKSYAKQGKRCLELAKQYDYESRMDKTAEYKVA